MNVTRRPSGTPSASGTPGGRRTIPGKHEGPIVAPDRKTVIRALGVFYVKTVLDGLKDVVLLPLAALAAALDLMKKNDEERESLGRVIQIAERFDRWLNLYGTETPGEGLGAILGEGGSDALLDFVERSAKELRGRKGDDDDGHVEP